MTDLSLTIAPKSDQLNADDLISGPRTIVVTGVSRCAEPDQPIAISFEGDGKKPYKPGKSMRRVLVRIWGADGAAYVGRAMTLYRDDKVRFGGQEVGGIRISHMSHIDGPVTMALTETRAQRKPFTVKPLRAPEKPPEPRQRSGPAEGAAEGAKPLSERVAAAGAWLKKSSTQKQLDERWDMDATKALRDEAATSGQYDALRDAYDTAVQQIASAAAQSDPQP